MFAVFFLLKVLAGISLTLVYTYYYTDTSNADIYRYFNDSKVISALLFQYPEVWLKAVSGIALYEADAFRHLLPTLYFSHPKTDVVTDNTLIIRIASVFNYFSFNNIYIDTLFFNFFSFIGLTLLFKTLRKYFEVFHELLFVPIYLLPSVLFWSNGMLKEQLAFTFIGFFFSFALNSNKTNKYLRWFLISLFVFLTYSVKPFIAISMLVLLMLFELRKIEFFKKTALSIAAILLFAVVFFDFNSEWSSRICEQFINKRNEFAALAIAENAGSCYDFRFYTVDCASLFLLVPKSLFYAVFSPFIWEEKNLFQFLFAAENTAFILLIAFLLIKYFQKASVEKLFIAALLFVFALMNYLVIGLTVPIIGAIVHYRVIAAPFFLISILLLLNQEKLKNSFLKVGL